MSQPTEQNGSNAGFKVVFQALYKLAAQRRLQFFFIILFSFLATGADLIQPLIYKYAIDDVTGLFVDRPVRERPSEGTPPRAEPREAHGKGRIAPRNREQIFATLIW